MNYYKRHIGDYLKDTSHLSLLEHGVYTRLLDVYYTREGPIPGDQAARLIAVRTKEDKTALHNILAEFFTLENGMYRQNRCEHEIYSKEVKTISNRVNGTKGGRPKNETQSEPTDNPNGLQQETKTETQSEPTDNLSHKPVTNNHKKDKTIVTSTTVANSGACARDDATTPKNQVEWIKFFADEHGVVVNSRSVHDRRKFWPLAAAWINAGITVGRMRVAIAFAQAEAKEPIAYLPGYVDRVLATMGEQKGADVAALMAEFAAKEQA